eukprot:11193-Heterococcus_DN1.PRE.1
MEEAGHCKQKGRERYEVIDLIPNGRDIPVTDANKREFMRVATKYKMLDRINPQLSALLSGFYAVIPASPLVVFNAQELELLMCGLDVIDVQDWRLHTAHMGALRPTHPLVRWFWEIVNEFDQEKLARLLQFVTGTSRVPVGGFRELQGPDGEIRLFTLAALPVAQYGTGAYPMSHTCFNRLDLPLYDSKETLRCMLTALLQFDLSTGFGKE